MFLTLFTVNPVSNEVLTGTVVNVIDGDTTINIQGERTKIR